MLPLVLLLTAFDYIEWRPVAGTAVESKKEELERRLARLASANHFDALGIHWSASGEEVQRAYDAMVEELSRADAWGTAPEAAKRILERALAAYTVLRHEGSRARYRSQTVDVDFAAVSSLVEARAKSLSMRMGDATASRQAMQAQATVNELEKSLASRRPPPKAPSKPSGEDT
jgi:hypothetical protein